MIMDQNPENSNDRRIGDDAAWKIIQKNTFTRWINERLKIANKHIENLEFDLSDGLRLISLLEVLSGKKFQKYTKNPVFRPQKLENVTMALKFLQTSERIKIVNIDSSDIVDHNLKLILGLVWMLILHYSISIPDWGDDEEDNKPIVVTTPNKELSPKQRLLLWIQNKVYNIKITNFTNDWHDGRAIGALVDGVAPGLCPDWEDWEQEDAVKNAGDVMVVAEEWLGVPQLITPDEMCSKCVDEQSMMTYLSQFYNAKLKEGAPLRPRTNASRVRVYGPGISPTGIRKGERVEFTVETFKAGKGELVVDLIGPDGQTSTIQPTFNNDTYLTYTCSWTPKSEGQHRVKVKYSNREIPKSPFMVMVEGGVSDPSRVVVSGPGLAPHGLLVGDETTFSVDTRDAGSGDIEIHIVDPTGSRFALIPKIQKPLPGEEWAVSYTPVTPGPHAVHVNFAGSPVNGSPFVVGVMKKLDPSKYQVSGRGVQKTGIRVDDLVTLKVTCEDGGADGGAEVKVVVSENEGMGKSLMVDSKKIKDSTHLFSYIPENPGLHQISVTIDNTTTTNNNNTNTHHPQRQQQQQQHIAKSPYTVEVKGKKDCSMVVYGPGLTEGVAGRTACFCLETNGETGPLAFQIEGPSQAQIDCFDNEDGSALISYLPVQPGEYAIHVMCDDDDINGSPFIANIISDDDVAFKPENIRVTGPAITETPLLLNTPTTFSVATGSAGRGRLGVEIYDSVGKTVSLRDVAVAATTTTTAAAAAAKAKREFEFTPPLVGRYNLLVSYDGVMVNGSPFRLTVQEPSDPSKVTLHGPAVTGHLLTFEPTYLIVDCSLAGPGDVSIMLTDDLGHDVSMTTDDYGTNSFKVTFTPTRVGAIEGKVYFGEKEIPASPITMTCRPSIDLSGVRVQGLDGKKYLESPHEFTISAGSLPTPGEFKVMSRSPSGKRSLVPLVADPEKGGKGIYRGLFTFFEEGAHSFDITYKDLPLRNDPFVVEGVSGCDPSLVKVHELGNLPGLTNHPQVFRVLTRGAGQGALNVSVSGPCEPRVMCRDNGDGSCSVEYLPVLRGMYEVSVTFAGHHVDDSPYRVEIKDDIDVTKLRFNDLDNLQPKKGQMSKFKVDTRSSGRSDLKVVVTDINGISRQLPITSRDQEVFEINFLPADEGLYCIDVWYGGQKVKSSKVQVLPIYDATKVYVSVNNSPALATLPTFVDVDLSKAGDADLNANVEDHLGEPLANQITRQAGSSIYRISFRPMRVGHAVVRVKYGGEEVKGSPWLIPVVPSGDARMVKLIGIDQIAPIIPINEDYRIPLDHTMAGQGHTTCQLRGDRVDEVPVQVLESTEGLSELLYQLPAEGSYRGHIFFGGQEVMGLAFVQEGYSKERYEALEILKKQQQQHNNNDMDIVDCTTTSTVTAHYQNGHSVNGYDNDGGGGGGKMVVVYDQVVFNIPVGPVIGFVQARITTPNDVTEIPEVINNQDGSVTVKYQPMQRGIHTLSIDYNDRPLPGCSPLEFEVVRSSNINEVKAVGPGLQAGICDAVCRFGVSFGDGDFAGLAISIDGPSKTPIDIEENRDGTLNVSYVPTKPGIYSVSVLYGHNHINGSPFRVRILPSSKDLTLAEMYIGSRDQNPIDLQMTINVKDLQTTTCVVTSSTGGLKQDVPLRMMSGGKLGALFNPRTEGEYTFELFRSGQPLTRSPIRRYIAPGNCTDVERVKVHGPGLLHPRTNDWNFFYIDYRNAGTGGLNISVDGPSKVEMTCSDDVISRDGYDNDGGGSGGGVGGGGGGDGKGGVSKIQFKPMKRGVYVLNVQFAQEHVLGSPFLLKVLGPNDDDDDDDVDDVNNLFTDVGDDDVVDGEMDQSYLAISHVGRESQLNLDIPGMLKDELRVFVSGPSGVLDSCYFKKTPSSTTRPPPTRTSSSSSSSSAATVGGGGHGGSGGGDDHHYSIGFVPKETGEHLVHVSRKKVPIAGSPFRFLVGPLFGGRGQVKVSGDGLIGGSVNVPGTFTVDTRSSGDGNLSITMEGVTKPDVSFRDLHDGTCDVTYTCSRPGDYLLSIRFNGDHVRGSPYRVRIAGDQGPGVGKMRKKFMPNEPVAYDMKAPTGKGHLQVKVIPPSGAPILPIVQSLDKDQYIVRFLPRLLGLHKIEVTQMGQPLPNSPFKLYVGDLTSHPEKVICTGQGLTKGHTGEQLKFQVHTDDAGSGTLEVNIDGPSKVHIRTPDPSSRPLTFVYVPHCPGIYKVNVIFDGKPVTTSPFKVKVKGPGRPLPWNELSKCEVVIPPDDDGVYNR